MHHLRPHVVGAAAIAALALALPTFASGATAAPASDQHVSAGAAPAATSASAAKKRKAHKRRPKALRRCRTRKQRRSNRCKTERIGKRRSKSTTLGKNVGGAGDQYLPFDNGRRVKVTQGNNTNISHGTIYTRFAWDFDVAVGTTVRATASGVVKEANGGCPPVSFSPRCGGGYGNNVVLRHEDGSCSRYAHLSRLGVTAGQPVGVYAVLGASGNSGYSYGRHLHYQRENCATRRAIPSLFLDAGIPRTNDVVVSGNRPDAPVPSGSPNAGAPAAVVAAPSPGAPTRTITVDNRVTNGGGMREDSSPARLTTQPWVFCGRRGCNIGGTERSSGQTYEVAICQTSGERTTNGNDADPSDDGNPSRFESNRYYGVRLSDGRFGYVSEVWIQAGDRGGLGLPGC